MSKKIIRMFINGPGRLLRALYYKSALGSFGWKSIIIRPLKIEGGKRIFIGNHVLVKYKSWLAATSETGYNDCTLILEDGCTIGNLNHIYATHSIVLHKNVLTADKVYITDNLHGYEDINVPIIQQPILQKGEVEIGEGSWLGENVCVIGARIGRHCVIGANSVVTKDIPDYSVAVGSPARIIKQYDINDNTWKKIFYRAANQDIMEAGGVASVSYVLRKPCFKKYHFTDVIKSPLVLTPKYIELGEKVCIEHHARIEGIEYYAGVSYNPTIRICDKVSIQQNLHLTCANYIEIGSNTAIAANVTITDIHHPYEDISIPIDQQQLDVKEVVIGEDCKIYNNSVILPGVHIGKHVTIGANSVVSKDIPDYCIAVGSPAKVIKRYNFEKREWVRVKNDKEYNGFGR